VIVKSKANEFILFISVNESTTAEVLEKQKPKIFQGVRVYVTGFTEPPLHRIKQLLGNDMSFASNQNIFFILRN
jgi:hypothetical protein